MNDRIDALREAVQDALPYTAVTAQGRVLIGAVEFHDAHVDVWLGVGAHEEHPDYQVYNPPTMVEDASAPGGYRKDPMLALAQAIALAGGASDR